MLSNVARDFCLLFYFRIFELKLKFLMLQNDIEELRFLGGEISDRSKRAA